MTRWEIAGAIPTWWISILYDSADSYAQLRTIYLQNRRFELGETDAASEIDPYALDTEGF
ncbi:hypothetical protein ACFOHS_02100 [Jhaorihella thermophila]